MIRQVGKKKSFSRFLKTKIVATIGPSSCSEKTLVQMIKNGMSTARLNFSHGTHEDHLIVIKRIRKICENEDTTVTLLQDLGGPKIRLGHMDAPVPLKKNQVIKLSANENQIQEADLYTDFKELPHLVKPGDTLLLDDGYIELTALEVETHYVMCRVKVPGTARSRKGINLPDVSTTIPAFTSKDSADLAFGLEQKVDMVAVSFVESADNITPVREKIKRLSPGREIPVIAKIERPTALKNIDGIIETFDGIMIARGDLGVEVAPEEVPVIQKKLIHLANFQNKLVITATQMLESMMTNPRPTRAEASDVSNAILDGTDAVMLSGETASGKYPVHAVNMMKRIALTTENSKLYYYAVEREKETFSPTEAIVKSAAELAKDLNAKAVMVFTLSGNTALLLSKYRPQCPILAFTPHRDTVSRMTTYWGVAPHYIDFSPHTDEMIRRGEQHAKARKLLKPGDLVVTAAGVTPMKGATNMVKVSKIV